MGKNLGRDFSYSVLMVSKIPLEDRGRRFVNQYLFEKTRFTDLNGLSPHTIARIATYRPYIPNDEPMFWYFPNAVGVKNVLNFTDRMKHLPTFVASK